MTGTTVIGEGWAALAALTEACTRGDQVTWITTSGARLAPPLSYFESLDAAQAVLKTCQAWAIDPGEIEEGNFSREFRNKAFRPGDETTGVRFSGMDLYEIKDALIEAVTNAPGVERIENTQSAYQSGAACMLQVSFVHSVQIGPGARETWVCPMYKESGEAFERKVSGYFSADGRQSTWSVDLTSTEGDDNHEIAKRLRKIKQTLTRIFTVEWLPAETKDFLSTIETESVRFAEVEDDTPDSKHAAPARPRPAKRERPHSGSSPS